ncbi:MAG: T9SS type A sorting domain-containing protein, partial [Candidatus Marinimicrobia bacterium]|nr:T9SS type A sorting domain-containing protein [Candidatus Neomarinimicrobiota bacterium]
NNFSNNLTGNIGDNHFMSFDGENIINGRDGFDRMIFQGDFDYYAILPPSATGDSSTKIIDFVPNRDGTNFLFNIEEVEFNGIVYNLNDFLDNGSEINLPTEFAIYAPYPNPFNPTTSILFDIAKTEHVDLSVFNIKGEFIKSLQNESLDPGQYSIKWHGLNEMGHTVPSGIYIIKFTSNFTQKNRKVLFLK